MKKYLFIILLISNCANSMKFESANDINIWINKNIQYENNFYIYRCPDKTLNDMSGSCADMSILLMKLIYDNFGDKAKFVDLNGTHAVVYYDGYYYDPTIGLRFKFDPIPQNTTFIEYDLIMLYSALNCL